MELSCGDLVVVLAGKYKKIPMIVVEVDDRNVYVCDGRHRKLERPKKLNKKHVERLSALIESEVKNFTNNAIWREIQQKVRLDNGED